MSRYIQFGNRILNLDAITLASYWPQEADSLSQLHVVVNGVELDFDERSGADGLWKLLRVALNPDDWTAKAAPAE